MSYRQPPRRYQGKRKPPDRAGALLDMPGGVVRHLRDLSRRAPSSALRRRATLLVALHDGMTYEQAARDAGVSVPTVRKWRRRYIAACDAAKARLVPLTLDFLGSDALKTRGQQVTRVTSLLRRGRSTRQVAQELGLSQSAVARIRLSARVQQ